VSLPAPAVHPVLVIGGGISGLVCAYQLEQAGIPVRLLEAEDRPGGAIATKEAEGFRFDLGPQSFLSTEPLLALINALGLKEQVQHAEPRAPRYILVGGQLVRAPLTPPSLLTTPLFSAATKWRLLTEILRRTKPPEEDESIAAFVRRKFGAELLDRLVAPFVSGVYAGDAERLSLRAAFPKLYEFEEQYGSVLRGAMKSRPAKAASRSGLCSFRGGMETLPRAIAARLGDSLWLESGVTGLQRVKANGKPLIEVSIVRNKQREVLVAHAVVIATPAHVASLLARGLSAELAAIYSRIEYAPVAVLSAGYRHEQFARAPDGFGFLVPREEGMHVLGTVFNSSLFAGRAPEGMVSLTSFAGGATDPKFCELGDAEITGNICAEGARVLGITGKPVATHLQIYPRALPQYNLGHLKIVESLETLEKAMPELFLAGNYLCGPSIGACVEQANRTAQEVRVYLASIGVAGVGAVAHA
jgi:protoporphyrinogen/coproporphyrinogen III oxidase